MQDNGVRVGTGYMFAGVTEGSNGRAKKRKPDLNSNKVDDSAVRFPLPLGKQVRQSLIGNLGCLTHASSQ